MNNELPKNYAPKEIEPFAEHLWKQHDCFHPSPDDPGAPYAIVIPPPNVTAALHLGHALNNTLQDILVRWRRMSGDNAVWFPGTDHAGIATQTVVEKRVLKEEGKRRVEFQRDAFVAKIQAWKDEYEARILEQLRAMGCSCDWQRTAFTMDNPRARAVREAFFQLFRDGLIYRGKRLVNWDPVTQTALSDDEVEMEDIDGFFYYLRYPLEDGSGHVTVATTRPETMLGDTAVGMNPKDPRAAQLRGKRVRLPIVNRIIPIIEDDYVVLPISMGGDKDDPKAQFATGFLKVTPAHDTNDYEIGQRHKLPLINVMAPDASISNKHGWSDVGEAGFLLGKSREEARKLVVNWFKEKGLLEDVKPYRHGVGHSYRSHAAIEPYLSDQWYCRVTDARLAGAANAVLAKDQINASDALDDSAAAGDVQESTNELRFFPARYAKTYFNWHENIRDWCISRQLWWGHRIPVWTLAGDHAGKLSLDPAVASVVFDGRCTHVCPRFDDPAIISAIEKLGFVQDPDVLDTWFSSALWPMSTMGWPDQTPELAKWNPTSVLCTAREIITLWVSRMVMFNLYFLKRLPFRHVYIHAMIQDGEGRKMSKSLGNGVDPLDIIDSHGCDAMRFTLASMATNTQDVRMPVEPDPATGRMTSPKFDLGRNFCNKLWNAARFVLMQLSQPVTDESVDELKWTMAERWIVSRFNRTVQECLDALRDYRFDQYARSCYDFFWRDFCDWYVEASKPLMRDPARRAQSAHVLASVLDGTLRLLHPIAPFITETLWQRLNHLRPARGIPGRIACPASDAQQVLATAPFPTVGDFAQAAEAIFPGLQEIVVAIRNLRNDYKVDLKKTVTVSVRADSQRVMRILDHKFMIEPLATCSLKDVRADLPTIENAAKTSAAGCEIFVEGLIDESAEQARIAKRREELSRTISALKARLGNEGYIARAPAKLVQETRDQLTAAEAELAKLS